MRVLIAFLTILLTPAVFAQTNVLFGNVTDFGLAPRSNITMTLSIVSPLNRTYNGQLVSNDPKTATTDTNGLFSFTNVIWGNYKLNPSDLSGTVWRPIVGTNTTGTVSFATIIANPSVLPPNPATNYYTQAQVDALLYGVTSGALTNAYATNAAGIFVTNRLAFISTNYASASITNGLATTNYVNAATNGFVTASVTNGLATTNYVNNATNGFVTASITNGLATTNYVNTATNGFVTTSITNGLATTNYVNNATNSLATTNYVKSATNGLPSGIWTLGTAANSNATAFYLSSNPSSYVTSSVTNGLATTNYVNTATNGLVTASVTNGLATTNFVLAQGFVTSSVTNGLATTNYVNTATNGVVNFVTNNYISTTQGTAISNSLLSSISATNTASLVITTNLIASKTNFDNITVTNYSFFKTNAYFAGDIYVTNSIIATGGGTNVFDVTLFTNGVTAYVSSVNTNTAAINTSSNPTNSYVVQTLYTNPGQRCILVGSVVIPATSTAGGSGCNIRYTNNAVGYTLQIGLAHANGASGFDIVPFFIPFSPSGTFKVETNAANSAGIYLTNVVCWRL